ncbi:acetolactate synthase large subunit [Isoptericola sp. BMS4]|uniref:acetolactate synthase large subunit n=1 Tax=Isoptericola sp. BMS4 TaxID=2527875 RepID=UPI0014221095|nr:acetolactate synthase large subunit [Isoptericola sp. BMS4]
MTLLAAASCGPIPSARTTPRLVADDAAPAAETITGARAVVRTLERLGVTDVFGIPGGTILPTYDALMDSQRIRHVLVRHEQGAGHAAEGYAVASGRVGVAMATSGPGATNLVTAIMDAKADSVPLLVITGQVRSDLMGTDAFQEADIEAITLPLTKHSYVVTKAEDIPGVLAEAYHLAGSGRPGPVLVDITKDAQQATTALAWPPEGEEERPGRRRVSSTQIGRAAEEIARAARPVLYAGGGVVRADAASELRELAEVVGAPVVTTLMARGVLPDSHPQNLGMPGMHGTVPAVLAMQEADLIIAVGARFDERVTGDTTLFAPDACVVHIDIDPAEISKIRHAHVPIVADARTALAALCRTLRPLAPTWRDLSSWWRRLDDLRQEFPLGYTAPRDGLLAPQHVIRRLSALSGPEATFTAGVGQHQMWAAQFLELERPRQWINSGGAGTMGFAVPAAMGAKIAAPDRVVWAIDGDGSFQMTNQELATCALNDIPIKVAIINNSALGMIRQWQTLFYSERYSNSALHTGHEAARIPDFVRLADAYGCAALRVEREEDVDEAIRTALAINDRPVVLDVVVGNDAMVWPMVPQGVGNDRIQYAREHLLAFGDAD